MFRVLLVSVLVITVQSNRWGKTSQRYENDYDSQSNSGSWRGNKGQVTEGDDYGSSGQGEAGPEPPAVVPETNFRCEDKPYQPGMYADQEVDCRVYHMCFNDRKESFLCGTGTVFNQKILSCDHPQNVDCGASPSFYAANEELGKPGSEPAPGGGQVPGGFSQGSGGYNQQTGSGGYNQQTGSGGYNQQSGSYGSKNYNGGRNKSPNRQPYRQPKQPNRKAPGKTNRYNQPNSFYNQRGTKNNQRQPQKRVWQVMDNNW